MDLLERWALIVEAPGYEVSSRGRVRRGLELVPAWSNAKGYRLVSLDTVDGPRLRYVHRLVLEAFRPHPHAGLLVNHRDGRKSRNVLENVVWSTPGANVVHGRRLRLERRFGQRALLLVRGG